MIQILNNLREQIYRYRIEYTKDEDYHGVLLKEHKEIYDAIVNNEREKAMNCVKTHIYNQEIIMIRNIQEQEVQVQKKK